MKRKIFIILILTTVCGIHFYLNVIAKEKSGSKIITTTETASSNAVGAVGSGNKYQNDLAGYTLPGPMGPTSPLAPTGIRATNTTTGDGPNDCLGCLPGCVCCDECTLATACEGDIITFEHIFSFPPYDLVTCSPYDTYWYIYEACICNLFGPTYLTPIGTSTYILNTTGMPPGTYWIKAICSSNVYQETNAFPFVIEECPDTTPGCNRCECNYEMWFSDFTIDKYGYAFANLQFPPVPPASLASIDKMRITLVNYHSEADDECKKCDIQDQEMFGDIIYAPIVYSANPEYAPYNPSVPIYYSREVTWCFDQPINDFNPGNIILGFRFPPVKDLECCRNDASFCLRIEFWDDGCKQCDQLICLDWDLAGLAPNKNANTHSAKKSSLRKGNIETIPNPTQNNFDMKIAKEDLPGFAIIYDVNGSMVGRINVSGEITSVNSKNWKPGIYFINYISKTASYAGKIIIDRK